MADSKLFCSDCGAIGFGPDGVTHAPECSLGDLAVIVEPPPVAPPLHWICWIHDTPEECGETCGCGYWQCPECDGDMESDDDSDAPYRGIWRCPDCDTFVDFARMTPAGRGNGGGDA